MMRFNSRWSQIKYRTTSTETWKQLHHNYVIVDELDRTYVTKLRLCTHVLYGVDVLGIGELPEQRDHVFLLEAERVLKSSAKFGQYL